MNDYVIITDSTCDLPADFVEENGIRVQSFTYQICGKEYHNYLDYKEQSIKAFYDLMRAKYVGTTAQLNMLNIIAFWETSLAKGLDILVLGFSSGLSGSFNAMRLAKEELESKYPNRKILLIDTLLASGGQGLYVYYANEYKKQGLNIDEAYQKLLDLRPHIVTWFTVDDIGTLHRGGRLSGGAATAATLLRIKPVLKIDDEGHLIAVYKKIGRKQALLQLINSSLKGLDTSYEQTVIVSHSDCEEDAKYVGEKLIETAAKTGYKLNIFYNEIGPVIGAHTGPGTVIIASVGEKR